MCNAYIPMVFLVIWSPRRSSTSIVRDNHRCVALQRRPVILGMANNRLARHRFHVLNDSNTEFTCPCVPSVRRPSALGTTASLATGLAED